MEEWKLEKSLTKDHTNDRVGPSWIPRATKDTPFEGLSGKNVWASGPSGELKGRIIDMIGSSEDFLCVSSFLFSDKDIEDALVHVAEEGIRVYLLSAYELQFGQAPLQGSTFLQDRLQESKATLDRLAGRVLVRTAEHLHAKMIVSDPNKAKKRRGLLLTANITTDALTRNPELGIEVPSRLVDDMYLQFCRGFWNESSKELTEAGRLSAVQDSPIKDLSRPDELLVTDNETHSLREGLEHQIESSEGDLTVSCYGFNAGHLVMESLFGALKDGRKTVVLARPRNSVPTMEALLKLAKGGARVLGHSWIHAKALLTERDGKHEGIVMTANIEERGLDTGFEMGVRLKGRNAGDLRRILVDWSSTFPYELVLDPKLGDVSGNLKCWRGGELQDIVVEETHDVHLGELEASSIEEMETTGPPTLPPPPGGSTMYKKYVYSWTVVPPKLPRKAKPVKEKHPLAVYQKGKKKFVVIEKKGQLDKAKKLAEEIEAKVVVSSE